MNRTATLALVSAAIWAVIAFTLMWWGHYELSAVSFMVVALSIYVYEVRKDA